VLWRAAAAALCLHLSVVLLLVFGNFAKSENKYTPLAVVEFSQFDPEGGRPGGGKKEEKGTAAAPKPALNPPNKPESTPDDPLKTVESVSEKAAPAPSTPPRPQEKPKPKKPDPKPKPEKATMDEQKSDDQARSSDAKEENGAPDKSGMVADQSPGPEGRNGAAGGEPGTGQGGLGGGTGTGNPDAFKAYTAAIQKKLNRYKKYPPAARSQGLEGVVTVNFTVNRQGEVVQAHLDKSSGHPELDEEVMALVKRVSPFPAMPTDMTQTTIHLTVPIQFSFW